MKTDYILDLFLLLLLIIITNLKNAEILNKCENISHGCGLFHSVKYTNSLEAFHNSYGNGYRKIEIDLSVTTDKHIVGAHDWKLFKELTDFKSNNEINYTYIKNCKIMKKYNVIYDIMMFKLLKRYKDVIIVTDKITDYVLLKRNSIIINRIYVEVGNYQKYMNAYSLGFRNILLSTSNSNDLNRVLNYLSEHKRIFGIVISPEIFYNNKTQLLLLYKKQIEIYVYGINNKATIDSAICKYVSGFYVD